MTFKKRLACYNNLLKTGFSLTDTEFILELTDFEDITEALINFVNHDGLSHIEALSRVKTVLGIGRKSVSKSGITSMILKKSPIYEQVWQLLYLASSQVYQLKRDDDEIKRFNLVWKNKSIILFLFDNAAELNELIDFTTTECQWIMNRNYRLIYDQLPTIIHEYDDEAEENLPDAKSLYRCLEQGLTPHSSLLNNETN